MNGFKTGPRNQTKSIGCTDSERAEKLPIAATGLFRPKVSFVFLLLESRPIFDAALVETN